MNDDHAEMKEAAMRMIQEIMGERGWSASRLAREASLSPSTVTRALDPNSTFIPSRVTIAKLMPFLAGQVVRLRNEVAAIHDQALYNRSAAIAISGGKLALAGEIRAGVWVDAGRSEAAPQEAPAFWDASWPAGRIAAFVLGDDLSHDRHARGTYVFTAQVSKDDASFRMLEGDEFVLRRRAHFLGSHKSELALWRYSKVEGEGQLTPVSSEGDVKQAISDVFLGSDVDIVGRVVGYYDRRPWPEAAGVA